MKREDKDPTKGDIYLITCLETNKQYVGQAKHYVGKSLKPHGANGRWHRHISKAKNSPDNRFSENTLWYDIKKFGSEKFKIEVLEVCEVQNLSEREAYHIENNNTLYPIGYNIIDGKPKNPVDKKFSEASRQNISKLHKKTQPELPMYMVYIKAREIHDSGEGYAIINHPKSRSKYFTSKKLSLEEKYNLALQYLQNL